MGQGSDTAMAQMVGEVSTCRPSQCVVPRDTDVTPTIWGRLGSGSLFHMGHASVSAEDARVYIAALRNELESPTAATHHW